MRTKAEVFLFLVTFIWAGTFVIIKPTLNYISPLVLVSIRFLLATFILFLFYRKKVFGIPKDSVKKGMILGFFLYLGFVVQTIGMQYTTATKSALITGTFVIFTPILQTTLEKKMPRLVNILGVLLVTIGMLLLSAGKENVLESIKMLGADFNFGDFLTLICAICYAIYIVYLDIISPSTKFHDILWLQISFTVILSVFTLLIFDFTGLERAEIKLNYQVIITIIYTSILATLLTTFLQTKYQRFTTPTRAAIIFTGEPLFASILAFLFLNERLGLAGIVGGLFILTGILISELFDKQK